MTAGPSTREAIVARIRAHPLGDTPAEMRADFADLMLAPAGASGTIRCGDTGPATVVHFHGGGYVFGSPLTHGRLGEGLANASGLGVVLASYPLAPEHPWPAQLDAALAACDAVDGPVILSGDSAGGHLALVTALELARRGTPVAGLILFSPNTDRTDLSTTRAANDAADPMVDDAGDRALAAMAFGDRPADDPQVSPLLDDLSLLPPTHIEVGGGEVLLDDSRLLAERGRAAGADVTLHVDPHGLHMGQLWSPWWPVANRSLARAGQFAKELAP